jgi:ABC-type multidrug transport system fused ATPase/permease subunit
MTQPDPLSYLIPLLLFSSVSGVCSAMRGFLFTKLNHIMYDRFSTDLFDRIRSASMETWDIEWKESQLTKTIITDMYDVILTIGLFWNVSLRTIITMLCVSFQWYRLSPFLFAHGIMAGVCHMTLFHIVKPYYHNSIDQSTKNKQAVETNMNEYVQKHTSIMLYGWQSLYEETHARSMRLYQQSIDQDSYWYAALLLTSQMLPGWGETYLVLCTLQQGYPISFLLEVITYYQLMNSALQACKDQWIDTWKKRSAMKTLWTILEKIPRTPHGMMIQMNDASIEWDQITFQYPTSHVPVFTNFSLSIQAGECVILSAKSGRGKTTLLSLLLGMYPVEKGQIRIGSHDISMLHPSQLSEWISIIPQDPWYDPNRTVRENIMMGLKNPFPEDLLDRVKLSEFQSRKEERIANVSGGQKQRLALARVLVRDTPIVIVDEPTSALDEETELEMISLLKEHGKGKTVVWITHRMIEGVKVITF